MSDLFRAYVDDAQRGTYHPKWVRANPGEAAKWAVFRDGLLAGEEPAVPVLATWYGRALVHAGEMELEMLRGSGPSRDPVTPPANTAVPEITGSATVGGLLTTSTGTWDGAPTAYGYQWQRKVGGQWFDILGATGSVYTVETGDVEVRARVAAQNAGGETEAVSASVPVSSVGPSNFGGALPERLATSLGDGGTIYIDPSGSDTTGDGSSGNPYRSLNKAFSVVNLTGGLILCGDGTYNWAGVQQQWSRAGSITNPVQVKADTGASPVFSNGRLLIGGAGARGIRVGPGLRFTASPSAHQDGIKISEADGWIEIVGCTVDNNLSGNGILISDSGNNITQVQIWDCILHSNGSATSPQLHGIYWAKGDATCLIANCVGYNNRHFNFQFGPACKNLIATCCTAYGQKSGGFGGFVIWEQDPDTNVNNRLYGCIAAEGNQYGVNFSAVDATDGHEVHDCVLWSNALGTIEPQAGLVTSNNTSANPVFVDGPNADFRLGTGSSAIDHIDSAHYGFVPPSDILGNPRITADAGAYAKEA